MLVDISTYVGHWPFRKLTFNTLSELDILARENDITHMAVASLNGIFYKDANEGNLELIEELSEYKGETVFIPFAIVNPTYPGWEKNARKMIELGFRGFELCPRYHGYSLAPEMLYDQYLPVHRAAKVMELARELNVPVRICASFENFRGRSELDTPDNVTGDELYALLSKFPDVTTLVTSFSPMAAGEHFGKLIKERKNIFFDTTQGGTLDRNICRNIKNAVSEDCLCLGTLSPFQYIETNLLRVELADFDSEKVKGNGARALGIVQKGF